MSVTTTNTFNLRSDRTGLAASLRAQLYDTASPPAAVGAAVASGFAELAPGRYQFTYAYPDGFQGSVIVTLTSDPDFSLGFAVNPVSTTVTGTANVNVVTINGRPAAPVTPLTTDEAQAAAAAALTAQGLTTARAGKLDNLDVTVGSRATPAQVATTIGATEVKLPAPPSGYGGGLTSGQATDLTTIKAGVGLLKGLQLIATVTGTPTTTSIVGDNTLPTTANRFSTTTQGSCWMVFVDGPNAGESRKITGYSGSTRTFTFASADAWAATPAAGNTFAVYARYK